jgi:hypothetical protein
MFDSLEASTSCLTSGDDDDMADAALFIVYETQKSIIASLIQRIQPAKFQQLNRWMTWRPDRWSAIIAIAIIFNWTWILVHCNILFNNNKNSRGSSFKQV